MRPPPSPHRRRNSRAAARTRPNAAGGGTVAVRVIMHLVDVGVRSGLQRDSLLLAAGVNEGDFADPDARVPLASEIALWRMLAAHNPDPAFGVRAGSDWHIRTMGLAGYVARFSATLRGALKRVERYGRLFTEAVEFTIPEGRDHVALTRAHPRLGAAHPLAESHRLAAVLQTSRELTGVDIVPVRVAFTSAEPSHLMAHRQHFRCPLHFGMKTAQIVFRSADLDLPIKGSDEVLAGYLSKYADQVLTALVRGETMRHKVRAAIWSLLGDGTPSLDAVADAVGLPPRTMQRRLADEGTSLNAEVERIRKTMALAVLRDRSVSIEDIAFLLGYSEPSTFFRAFKRWTGTTPRRFRARAA